jgi:hypothetical protein
MSFTQGIHCTGWVTPDPVWTAVEKRQISAPAMNQKLIAHHSAHTTASSART